jgi:HPt (histidine-containing phosphotransfer) domain-containing protein
MPATFNVDALKAELELDHEDVVELIGEFRTFLEESMVELGKAFDAGELTKARSVAHSIKGSAGNLRVSEVFETSKSMQFMLDEGQEKEASDLFLTLKEQAQAFLAESENFS